MLVAAWQNEQHSFNMCINCVMGRSATHQQVHATLW